MKKLEFSTKAACLALGTTSVISTRKTEQKDWNSQAPGYGL